MRIQNISTFFNLNNRPKQANKNEYSTFEKPNIYVTNPTNITFEARVDKGLVRFYEANAERMPKTVKKYIETLSDKSSKTPIQAQATAFAALIGATTVGAIKSVFPEEELFKDLKSPDETKATRGILNIYRENKELLELCNQSILANKEDLTVWLVKKIFLEAKTLEEINADFDKEIDKDFKELYEQKETSENREFIRSTTLKSLGIKLPEFEYLQSLRYTREGYSDIVGEKISQAQKDFYASLPIEERTARARKSVENFENWWNSLGRDKQLDMIALQVNELEMLEKFNASGIGKKRSSNKISSGISRQNQAEITKNKNDKKEKINSSLSQDDLFKIWAGNNLKLFEASLTEYDRRQIEIKREQHRAQWWESMTSKERTEYINKLRTSAEPLRFAMIDAWNNNQDILIELSHTLKKNHFTKPTEIIYGTEKFNEYMSDVMSDFWTSHPDYAERIGIAIKDSHEKIKNAISNGRFEILKQDIFKARNKREKETLEAVKNYRELLSEEIYNSYPKYMQEFIDAYSNSQNTNVEYLPVKYLQEYYDIVATELPQEVTESWSKALRNEKLSPKDIENTNKIRSIESPRTAIISRAIEATLAEILFECTQDPEVYMLSHSDCKMAIKQVTEGRKNITIHSHKLNRNFDIPVVNNNVDPKDIDKLYEFNITPLSEEAIDSIVDQYFEFDNSRFKTPEEKIDLIDFLKSYIEEYRNSNVIIFGLDKSKTPKSKACFVYKFLNNLPDDIDTSLFKLKVFSENDFKKEEEIYKIDNFIRKKYSFLPKDGLRMYIYELNKALRSANSRDLKDFEESCCKPQKKSTGGNEIVLLDRKFFTPYHMIYTLCLEQAMADILYENSKNEEVYSLIMEELLTDFEALMLEKKFPLKDKISVTSSTLGKDVDLSIKYRIQPYQIEKKFKEYYDEITEYINECLKENKALDKEEILCILNNDESKTITDKLTMQRIENTVSKALLTD